jgi:hypothetical protein
MYQQIAKISTWRTLESIEKDIGCIVAETFMQRSLIKFLYGKNLLFILMMERHGIF